jgi:hypothetical protein
MVEPPVPYLEPIVPAAARQRHLNWDCWLCLFGLSYAISSTTVYLVHYLRGTATVMARKRLLQAS